MTREFPERDWKIFRRLRERALERFFAEAVDELGRICGDGSRSVEARYREAFRFLDDRDRAARQAFDYLSRSRMLPHLATMVVMKLVDDADLGDLSTETQTRVRAMVPSLE